MEVISLAGYTLQEKIEIATNYLVPRQIVNNGIKKEQVNFTKEGIEFLIKCYTREAGVRNLERTIGSLCRKIAYETLRADTDKSKKDKKANINQGPVTVNPELVRKMLGPPFYEDDIAERIMLPGIAIGMAWTQMGGKILLVEASKSLGKGNIEVTGHLGDVMRESIKTALSYIKSNLLSVHEDHLRKSTASPGAEAKLKLSEAMRANLGKKENVLDTLDIHIHFPAAAIPKDGPSAGITITVALVIPP